MLTLHEFAIQIVKGDEITATPILNTRTNIRIERLFLILINLFIIKAPTKVDAFINNCYSSFFVRSFLYSVSNFSLSSLDISIASLELMEDILNLRKNSFSS